MAQALPRTHLNSSRLVRVLAGLGVTDLPEAKQSAAEKLGDWLGLGDALSLYSALHAVPAGASERRSAAGESAVAADAARREFERVKAALAGAIIGNGRLKAGRSRIEWPTQAPQASAESAPDFAPYHQFCLGHQRDMTSGVAALRTSVRAALSGRSPALGRLAALDVVLEQVLTPRERALLATVPMLLGKRFEQLFRDHLTARADADTADDPVCWIEPGGWLAVFRDDMRTVLLAELELRLQPVAGLIAALDNEVTGWQ